MSKTLYRTYRPCDFSDVIGQEHITTTLQNAITSHRISHAYLFTGPRGTGKTTIARIFAAAVNTHHDKDQKKISPEAIERLKSGKSMDIIEIDAASHTGVDDVRALRETIALTPTESAYKVYIIDEVHMLSTSAFNALLKTLEEPPAHAIFILATTDVHKVPETILSRCQRFDFSRFSIENIIKKLTLIAEKEKVQISEEALEMIAIAADGGMRDAESLLAQVFALEDKNITESEVSLILGTSTPQDIIAFLESLCTRNVTVALSTLAHITQSGFNLDTFTRSVIEKLRILLYLSLTQKHNEMDIQKIVSIPKKEIEKLHTLAQHTTIHEIITMIEECVTALQKIRYATIQQLPLEIAAVRICENKNTQHDSTHDQKNDQKNPPIQEKIVQKTPTQSPPIEQTIVPQTQKSPSQKEFAINSSQDISEIWQQCIALLINQEHKTLAQLLTQCSAHMHDDDTLMICTAYTFYKDKLSEHHNRAIIEQSIAETFKRKIKITVDVQTKKEKDEKSSELLDYAQQLMGGASVNA